MSDKELVTDGSRAADKKADKAGEIDFTWGVQIPMRDGVQLNATIYKTLNAEPAPAIFTLTPYIGDSYHERATYFAGQGYPFLLVDCRGRGNSEGEFEPMANDGRDGHDIAIWLAEQAWCDGQVSMWGGSYGGFDQWATLKEGPSPLKTIVPVASAHPGVDFPLYKNIPFAYQMQWLSFTSGVAINVSLFEDRAFWIERFRAFYLDHRPYRELDQVVGNLSTHFQSWLKHPTVDDYWQAMVPGPEAYRRFDVPILSITGYYDGDQPGAMHFYRQHMRYGPDAATGQHYLVIGPWDHPGTRTPAKEFGGLTVGEASLVELNELHKEWYAWTMQDGERPAFLKERVAYYVMGADEWKYAPNLEAISDESRRLYLSSPDGSANDLFRAGTLEPERGAGSAYDQYVYDPLDVRPAEHWREPVPNWITQQTDGLHLYGNGLVYHSAPFAEDTEISGYMRLVMWLAMDVPDTDFLANVYEILPDGRTILLTSDLLRARYRDSLTEETLVTPGEINRYVFDGFTFFSRRIARYSRLRLLFKCPNSIYWQKNYNSGGVVADESATDARTATITLYHNAEYPSYLEFPIGRE